MAPSLPARKMTGGRRVAAGQGPKNNSNLPIMGPQEIELEDGTKIPVQIPPGVPPAQAHALLEYLRQNPEAARMAQQQANEIMKTPGMAQAFLNMRANMDSTDMQEKYAVLKDDPDLKVVFDDVMANGPSAMQKYWDDNDLMLKISSKLKGLNMGGPAPAPAGPVAPSASLHEAAKRGDVDAAKKFIDEGAQVDAPNEKGISPLGVAVGFNQPEMVTLLLEKGANINVTDPQGNTPLHYAAAYGRKAVAQLLLAAGADLTAENKQGMKPYNAAKMNKEKQLVELLQKAWEEKREAKEAAKEAAV